MATGKDKAWFVRVGPFGGVLPISWKGIVYMLLTFPFPIYLISLAVEKDLAGDLQLSTYLGVAGLIFIVVIYIGAFLKSRKARK